MEHSRFFEKAKMCYFLLVAATMYYFLNEYIDLGFHVTYRHAFALVLFGSAVLLFIFTYASGRRYPYYAIVMAAFGMLGFAALFALIPKAVSGTRLFRRAAAVLTAVIILLSPLAARAWSGNVYLLGTEKNEMPPYRFAETIRQSDDPTLLNYGFLDGGFYYAAESLPVTRFFCTINNDLPEMKEEFRTAISEGKTGFVITRQQKLKDSGPYRLVDEAEMYFEGRSWTYYLYQKEPASD